MTNKMPVLFVGHGSPMNAIEDNEFSRAWTKIGAMLPRPKAILCISAHWYVNGTRVTSMERPRTIHDFYGFPRPLYEIEYNAPGSPALAERVRDLLADSAVSADLEWGLDHGTWSVLERMVPKAETPVVQLSIDYTRDPAWHYRVGRQLSPLRNEDVLVVASGNIVHNLWAVDWKQAGGYGWAEEFDKVAKDAILKGDHKSLIEYDAHGEPARLSVPTNDHYLPMLYALGLVDKTDRIRFFCEKVTMGSVSMRGFVVMP